MKLPNLWTWPASTLFLNTRSPPLSMFNPSIQGPTYLGQNVRSSTPGLTILLCHLSSSMPRRSSFSSHYL
ncbi:Protein of unknown function [Pyronema omphalodes CBS 100304]|uniref:Uncharacterized protein n=1 Tax=Pyronema omphalodes (strain CBS 100304) TaxID=1076935 RepID=U4L036_PYROM|nr:Protein of unknown function [Pyronema omphalodes CBS 100304]